MCKYFAKYILSLTLLWLASWQVAGQNVSIQAKLDRAEMKTGEQAAIAVTIRTDDLSRTKFYLMEDKRAGEPFVVLEFAPIDTIELDERLKEITARLVITSFDSTLITIPPIIVETPSGQAQTEPMALNVIQPEVDAAHPENFKPIKAPWDVPLRLRDILEMILTSYIFWSVLLLLTAGYSYYRYRQIPKPLREVEVADQGPIAPELTTLELALEALAALEQRELPAQQAFKEYYTQLIDILKAYMDATRGWTTIEMTSSEVIALLEGDKASSPLLGSMRQLLTEADLSKFAKGQPSIGEAMASISVARVWVSQAHTLWDEAQQEGQAREEVQP